MAASKTIGGINVTISATTDKFVKGVNLARRTLTSMGKAVKNFIFSMKGLAVAFATGALVKFTANQFEAISALGDLSDKTGVATEKLAGFQLAATEAGISMTTLEKSLTTLSAKGMTLTGWVKETAKLTTHQERLNAAVAMFGKKGADMVRLTTGGAAGLAEAQAAAESLGLALDRKTVAGVDRAAEAFARFKMAVSGIFRSLAAEIAPFIEVLSNKAFDLLATSGAGKGIGKGIADGIQWMAKTVADLIQQMVAGVLSLVADFRSAWLTFKASGMGKHMGFEAGGVEEYNAVGEMRNRAAWLRHENNMPSRWIDKQVKAAAEAAAEAAAKSPAGVASSLIGRARGGLAGLLGTNNAKTGMQLGTNLLGKIGGGINAAPGMLMRGWWEALKFQANAGGGKGGAGQRPALAFAESGSADSYRQQAAIRRQSDNIAKQQLAVQKDMRDGIKKIAAAPPMRPANFQV